MEQGGMNQEREIRRIGRVSFDIAHADGCPGCITPGNGYWPEDAETGPHEFGLVFAIVEGGVLHCLRLTPDEAERLKLVIQTKVLAGAAPLLPSGEAKDAKSEHIDSIRFSIQCLGSVQDSNVYELHILRPSLDDVFHVDRGNLEYLATRIEELLSDS